MAGEQLALQLASWELDDVIVGGELHRALGVKLGFGGLLRVFVELSEQ